MLGWIMIFAGVTIMVKAAETEGRSTVLWGTVTAVLCIGCSIFIPFPLFSIIIGLVASYLLMFAMNVIRKD